MLGLMGFPNQNEVLKRFQLEGQENAYEEMRQNVGKEIEFNYCDELGYFPKAKRGVVVKALCLDERYLVKCRGRIYIIIKDYQMKII
jgi:hypothetical protein